MTDTPPAELDLTLISTVAGQVARRFHTVDRVDVIQELSLWWLKNEGRVTKYLDGGDEGDRKLQRALRNEASKFCHRERAEAAGYDVTDLFFYSPALLRELLPVYFGDQQAPTSSGYDPTGRTVSAPNEGNNFAALMEDIRRGLGLVSPADSALFSEAYGDELPLEQLAVMHGVDKHAMEMRLQRALQRLQDRLGGPRPDFDGPGSRRAMSNATALAVTRAQDGEE